MFHTVEGVDEVGAILGKRFDRLGGIVADFAKNRERAGPVNRAGSWGKILVFPAVVIVGVKMGEVRGEALDPLPWLATVEVCVTDIEMAFKIRETIVQVLKVFGDIKW